MTTDVFRSPTGTRFITRLAVIAASALLLLVASSPAHAADGRSSHALKRGTGMVAKPSVRVRALQRALVRRGYNIGRHGADGRFGPRTTRAVRRFQAARHIRVDGIVGRRTRAALRRTARSVTRRAHRPRPTATKSSVSTASQRPSTAPVERPAQAVRPSPQPSPRPSVQPRPAPLRVDSGPAWWRNPLLLGLVAALVAAFGAVATARYERGARAATYRRSRRADPDPELDRPGPAHAAASSPGLPSPPIAAELVAVAAAAASPAAVAAAAASPAAVGRHAAHSHVIGYVPVPANLRAPDMAASDRAIERVCERGGWRLLDIVREPQCSSLDEQSGISRALARIAAGEASALVVSDARLLGRSLDLAEVLRRLDAAEAALVAVDLGLDTSTPQGRRVASALITMSGWGRQRPAAARANGRREPEQWAGRLSLDSPEPAAIAHNGNGANGHNGHNGHTAPPLSGPNGNAANGHNGNTAPALSGPNGNTANGHNGRNGNTAPPLSGPNGNAANGHNGHTDTAPALAGPNGNGHNGHGAAAPNGHGHDAIADQGDATSRPEEEALTR